MGFFFGSKPARTPFALGKIPTSPEFLQARGTREPTRSFDEWLERAMSHAAHRYCRAWDHALAGASPLGFVWHAPRQARTESVLVGLLVPSRDAVGRQYPLVIAVEALERTLGKSPHVAPLAYGAFLDAALELAEERHTLAPEALLARVNALVPPRDELLVAASDEYDAWTEHTPSTEAWATVLGEPLALDVVGTLSSHAATTRRADHGDHAPILSLPLGAGGNAAVALWLDLVRRLYEPRSAVPSAFWDIETGTLLVATGDADPGALAALWLPQAEEASVLAPLRHPGQEPHPARGFGSLRELLVGLSP